MQIDKQKPLTFAIQYTYLSSLEDLFRLHLPREPSYFSINEQMDCTMAPAQGLWLTDESINFCILKWWRYFRHIQLEIGLEITKPGGIGKLEF